VTRLGESVFRTGRLSDRAFRDTLDVLKSFRKRAEEAGVVALRAVGTSALREADNARKFVKCASHDCGVDLDVISSREEARLIHLGVISRLGKPDEPLLLIDIGGGSSEFTVSRNGRISATCSAPLGAVRLSELFLDSDPPAPAELERLEGQVRKKLERIQQVLARAGDGPLRAIGTSGTMAALAGAVSRVEASRNLLDGQRFSRAEAEALYRRLRVLDREARAKVPGINAKRAELIVAGAAVVCQAMRQFDLPEVCYSDAGLRDGVLVDLAARRAGDPAGVAYLKDERLLAIRHLGERYDYAPGSSSHVARLARQLFQSLQPLHELDESYGELLEAAALLHDIGHYVNSAKHHKHTYYLIANSELPGWSDKERLLIANIARYHRGSWPDASHNGFADLSSKERRAVEHLAALLRLADACDHGRRRHVQSVLAVAKSDRLEVALLASGEAELEGWAAAKTADLFRKVFGRKLEVRVERMKPVAGA
jgi:exopolyphosphatase/guanosine-5'-triphosphate,3'-diphosphate pyrophosphatase